MCEDAGKAAIKVLLSEAYKKQKACPPVTDEEEAARLLHAIIPWSVSHAAGLPLSLSLSLWPPRP